jgi:hypothetical protein
MPMTSDKDGKSAFVGPTVSNHQTTELQTLCVTQDFRQIAKNLKLRKYVAAGLAAA